MVSHSTTVLANPVLLVLRMLAFPRRVSRRDIPSWRRCSSATEPACSREGLNENIWRHKPTREEPQYRSPRARPRLKARLGIEE
jgi:hypothetical protein